METTKLVSNEEQRNQIQEFIQTELLKRGFQAPIEEFKEVGRRYVGFEFHSALFQTTPVLFKNIQITNFSSSIEKHKTEGHGMRFWIQVHVSYIHFEGGTNRCSLFEVVGTLFEGKVYEMHVVR